MKYQLDKSKIDDIPCVALYRPNKGHYSPSVIACFIISDGWNEQALLELKEKAEADILVGLQTDNKPQYCPSYLGISLKTKKFAKLYKTVLIISF